MRKTYSYLGLRSVYSLKNASSVVTSSRTYGEKQRTQQRRQNDKPRPEIRHSLLNLLKLHLLILRPTLIITNAFKHSDLLFFAQALRVDRRIGQP